MGGGGSERIITLQHLAIKLITIPYINQGHQIIKLK